MTRLPPPHLPPLPLEPRPHVARSPAAAPHSGPREPRASLASRVALAAPTALAVLALLAFAPVPTRAQGATLPDTIPLFPLPDITLFPGVRQPLHIFEPRYRAMVADALEGDRVIGMVMLRPGYEDDYAGNPPIHAVGGAGIIEDYQELPDGRYNIVLRGTTRFTVEGESTNGPYRRARVETLPETLSDEDRVRLSGRRSRLEDLVRTIAPRLRIASGLSDEAFVNALCQLLPLEPADRQALLETENALERAEVLLERMGTSRQARSNGPR